MTVPRIRVGLGESPSPVGRRIARIYVTNAALRQLSDPPDAVIGTALVADQGILQANPRCARRSGPDPARRTSPGLPVTQPFGASRPVV